MAPSRNPSALGDGVYQRLENVRLNQGRIIARNPIAEIGQGQPGGLRSSGNLGGASALDAGTLPPATFMGAFQDSKGYVYCVHENPLGKASVYVSNDLSTWTRVVRTRSHWTADYIQGAGGYDPNIKLTRPISFVELPVPADFFQYDSAAGLAPSASFSSPDEVPYSVPRGNNCVVISGSGEDDDVVVVGKAASGSEAGDWFVEFHRNIPAPTVLNGLHSVAFFANYFDVASSSVTVTVTGTPSMLSNNPNMLAPGERYLEFSSPGGTSQSSTVSYVYGSPKDFSQSSHLVFFINAAAVEDFMGPYTIDLLTAANPSGYGRVYNPTSGSSSYLSFQLGADAYWPKREADIQPAVILSNGVRRRTGIFMVVIPLASIVWSGLTASEKESAPSQINGIRITASNISSAGQRAVRILGVAGSGPWTGLGQWAVSNANEYALSESPMVEIMSGVGADSSTIGVSSLYRFAIPEVPFVGYNYRVPIPSHIRTVNGATEWAYANASFVYRREYGSDTYYRVTKFVKYQHTYPGTLQTQTSTYTGYGAYTNRYYQCSKSALMAAFFANETVLMDVAASAVNFNAPGPGPYSTAIPPHSCAVYAGDRLYVGSGPKLHISQLGNPFRHTLVPTMNGNGVDAYSAIVKTFPQAIVGMKAVSASMIGANQIYVWTTNDLAAVDGVNPASPANRLLQSGCSSPRSIASYKGAVWALDDEFIYRIYNNGGTGDKTTDVVGTWFAFYAGEYARYVSGAWHQSRLYCTIVTPDSDIDGGQRVDAVLVYDDRVDAWCMDRIPAPHIELRQLMPVVINKKRRLVAFDREGRVFWYDDPFLDSDSWSDPMKNTPTKRDTAVRLLTGYIRTNPQSPVVVHRVGMLCSPLPSGIATIRKTVLHSEHPGPGYGDPQQTTILLNRGGWAWSPPEAGTGACGPAVSLDVSVNAAPGWELHSLVVEAGMSASEAPSA